MSAADTARILGAARKEGRNWRCRCPECGGKNLTLRDHSDGKLLAKCWNCNDPAAAYAKLHELGFLDAPNQSYGTSSEPRRIDPDKNEARIAGGMRILRAARSIEGTIVEKYLGTRGFRPRDLPDETRAHLYFHPHCPYPGGPDLPAMIGLVEHVVHGRVGIHRTFLRESGLGKADIKPDRASLGPIKGGAVRLGAVRPSIELVIGEGIETVLSVMHACGLPGWAALSALGIEKLILPPEATRVLVCADHDVNGTGQRHAREAAERFLAEGRRVRIALPKKPDTDFNDLLRSAVPESAGEPSYAPR